MKQQVIKALAEEIPADVAVTAHAMLTGEDTRLTVPVSQLHKGARFWEHKDKPSRAPAEVLYVPKPCKSERANIHLSTSRGSWCIPACATVLV